MGDYEFLITGLTLILTLFFLIGKPILKLNETITIAVAKIESIELVADENEREIKKIKKNMTDFINSHEKEHIILGSTLNDIKKEFSKK